MIVLQFVGGVLGGFIVGLMATSSKRAYFTYCVTQVSAPIAPAPMAGHCWPIRLQETLKGRSGSVSGGSLGPGAHKVLFEPSEHLWQVWGVIVNTISVLLTSCWGFSCLDIGYFFFFFFGGIQHCPVNGCSEASCNFTVFVEEDEHVSFYSAILSVNLQNFLELTTKKDVLFSIGD